MSKPKTAKNIDVPLNILKDLLTPSEVRMLKNRFHIIKLLEEGLSIRGIATQVKVGTDTVVRVSRLMEKNNLKLKMDKTLQQSSGQVKTSWIFGKND